MYSLLVFPPYSNPLHFLFATGSEAVAYKHKKFPCSWDNKDYDTSVEWCGLNMSSTHYYRHYPIGGKDGKPVPGVRRTELYAAIYPTPSTEVV